MTNIVLCPDVAKKLVSASHGSCLHLLGTTAFRCIGSATCFFLGPEQRKSREPLNFTFMVLLCVLFVFFFFFFFFFWWCVVAAVRSGAVGVCQVVWVVFWCTSPHRRQGSRCPDSRCRGVLRFWEVLMLVRSDGVPQPDARCL